MAASGAFLWDDSDEDVEENGSRPEPDTAPVSAPASTAEPAAARAAAKELTREQKLDMFAVESGAESAQAATEEQVRSANAEYERKKEEQAAVEKADLDIAIDALGISDQGQNYAASKATGVLSLGRPSSEAEFTRLAQRIADAVVEFKGEVYYAKFLEALFRRIGESLTSTQLSGYAKQLSLASAMRKKEEDEKARRDKQSAAARAAAVKKGPTPPPSGAKGAKRSLGNVRVERDEMAMEYEDDYEDAYDEYDDMF